MTTTVTVTAGDQPAYVYSAQLNDDLDGEYEFTAELRNETRTFHAHSRLDFLITENQLED